MNTISSEKRKRGRPRLYPGRNRFLVKLLQNIDLRCNYPNTHGYKYYGGKGIKNHLTYSDLNFLWERDNAIMMKQPSIDRRDSNRDYTLDNCRFVEMLVNIKGRQYKKIDPAIKALRNKEKHESNLIRRTLAYSKLQADLHIRNQDLTVREIGRRGGLARARNLSPERRSEIAGKAGQERWRRQREREARNGT